MRIHMKKFFASLLAVIAGICCLSFVSCTKVTENTLDKDVLVVGYTIYPPMNYFDDDNSFVGFDTELALEVGKILGKTIEFKEINWDNKVFALNSKEIDMVWNGMTITDELKTVMTISNTYMENKQVVVCQAGEASKYVTAADVANAAEVFAEADLRAKLPLKIS